MAPSWISTTNVLPNWSSSKPKNRSSSRRCPVDDTGKNSVRPSTMPRTTALKRSNDMGGSAQTKAAHDARFGRPQCGELFTQHQPYGNEKARKLHETGKPPAMEPIQGIR